MQATPVAPSAEPSTVTVRLTALDRRCATLMRFAEVKRQMRELRAEYNRLEDELFGAAAEEEGL